MKKAAMFAMVFVMMLGSLSGCFWWGYEGHGGGRGHGGDGGHDGGEGRRGGGGHEERR